jgi:type II secretory pathway pseudopilin PulG
MTRRVVSRPRSTGRCVRPGFSLVELLVALTLTLAVFAITLPFVRAQSRALGANAGRLDAEQVARYALRAIDRDLRLASADGVGQPVIVQAGPMAISFNVNLLAPDTTDPNAVAVEVGAAPTLTESWRRANAAPLPLGPKVYPTVDYFTVTGGVSRTETISYFLGPDTVSGRTDVYVLYRRVNARDSVQVVRGLFVPPATALFRYFHNVSGVLTEITTGLPLYFDNATSKQIRAVGIRASGFFRNRREGMDVIRTVDWRTILPITTSAAESCGAAPASPTNVQPVGEIDAPGYRVEVTWNRSSDDGGGASDVRHYQVLVRPNITPVVWEAVASVPATGAATYRFDHYLPSITGAVRYGVRAVDCGGMASNVATHTSRLILP